MTTKVYPGDRWFFYKTGGGRRKNVVGLMADFFWGRCMNKSLPWKIDYFFKQVIFRFHVNFPGSKPTWHWKIPHVQ